MTTGDLYPHTGTATPQEVKAYQTLSGELTFLAHQTRPDIAYSVNTLSRFNVNPSPEAIQAQKRILRYLRGTTGLGISYMRTGSASDDVIGYGDASYADIPDTRRSTSGYIFHLNGGPISWLSARQKMVTLSSTEAEYDCLTEAVKEAVWLQKLFDELRLTSYGIRPMKIYEDNQATIHLASNTVRNHKRTKHIDVRYKYCNEQQDAGNVKFLHVGTNLQAADGLTKPLAITKFTTFIGLNNLQYATPPSTPRGGE